MKNYIQNKLKDLNYRNYTYDKDIKGRNMNRRKGKFYNYIDLL